ncbi:unnamed protein product [Polarella glacialis]|uniref:Uncharacterized protein n=1 Tax=Polarella glacialis TaxID=89957 RepID=A0A813KNY2_POLGL|nr:unnamed protein product [Polarella glacialis]
MGKKGGKKKGGKEEAGRRMSPEEEYMYLSLQVETLERELQVKSAHAEEAARSELELRGKVEQMEEDFKGEQGTTYAVTADMARQYKAMNEYEYIYMKKRKDFGRRYCNFDDVEPKIIGQIETVAECGNMFVEQTILNLVLDNICDFSEHSVNTARVQTKSRVMIHTEGGWPKEVDYSEAQDTLKWRKRLEKDPVFVSACRALTKQTVMCLEQNNTIDLFEHYFQLEEPDHLPENLTMKTVAIFKDPSDEKRSVTKIGWHPEGPTKIVGSYSNLRFQRMTDEMPMASFIWDISERNVPLTELRTNSPLICCQFNNKNADLLVGGSYNGILNYYDLRKGPTPLYKSAVEVSHYDPVYEVVWLQSKTGTECASVSSDGRLLFWDVRKMSEVTDECLLTDGNKDNPKTLGGVSLEWMQEAGPTKFLVGSEHGITLACTKRPKKAVEVGTWFGAEDRGGYGAHFGPVYAVKRNPFHVKFFLTVGDWCAKIWMEELKGPMMQTPYYPSFLSGACWSPTRAGVFFLSRHDGRLDTWDYFYRMNEVSLSHKVSESALTSLSLQSQGGLMAVGDAEGTITLLQLCDGLVDPGPNEKNLIGQMFDRETKREKNLEQIKKQQGGAKEKEPVKVPDGHTIDQAEYQGREKAFFGEVGMTGDDLGTNLTGIKAASGGKAHRGLEPLRISSHTLSQESAEAGVLINSLETQLTEQKEELDITNHELKELIKDKDDDIKHKDEKNRQLNDRMNEMSAEFANMLAETLELMKHHINEKLSDSAGGDDQGAKPDFAQRLQDYSVKACNAVSISQRQGGASGDQKALAGGETGAAPGGG